MKTEVTRAVLVAHDINLEISHSGSEIVLTEEQQQKVKAALAETCNMCAIAVEILPKITFVVTPSATKQEKDSYDSYIVSQLSDTEFRIFIPNDDIEHFILRQEHHFDVQPLQEKLQSLSSLSDEEIDDAMQCLANVQNKEEMMLFVAQNVCEAFWSTQKPLETSVKHRAIAVKAAICTGFSAVTTFALSHFFQWEYCATFSAILGSYLFNHLSIVDIFIKLEDATWEKAQEILEKANNPIFQQAKKTLDNRKHLYDAYWLERMRRYKKKAAENNDLLGSIVIRFQEFCAKRY
jgi:hypothetical protein